MPIRAFSREKYEEQRFDVASKDLMQHPAVHQPGHDFHDAHHDAHHERHHPAHRLVRRPCHGRQRAMQIGDLIAFITYTMQIVMSFLMLTVISIMLPRAGVAADRIEEVLRTEPVIEDPKPEALPAGLDHKDWKGVVRFNHVNFRYPGADEDALTDIDFTAEPGKTTAIIGATGSRQVHPAQHDPPLL